MPKFSDNTGREWIVEINVSTIKRVRAEAGIDLLAVSDGTLIGELLTDPITLCNVIYILCKPRADEQGVTDELFGEAMAGDAIDHATEAMLSGLVSFSPSPKDRANLSEVLGRTRAMMDKARDLSAEKINSGVIEQAAEAEFAKMETVPEKPGGLSTSTPGSSG